MDQKNPYYLNQQNQLNVYNRYENKPTGENPFNIIHRGVNQQQGNYNNGGSSQSVNQQNYSSNYNNPLQYPPSNQYQPPDYQSQQYPNLGATYQQHQHRQFDQERQIHSGPSTIVDQCPYCNQMTQSIVENKFSWAAWVTCFFLFWFTVILFWVPFCLDTCKQRHIRCVKCHRTKYVIKDGSC